MRAPARHLQRACVQGFRAVAAVRGLERCCDAAFALRKCAAGAAARKRLAHRRHARQAFACSPQLTTTVLRLDAVRCRSRCGARHSSAVHFVSSAAQCASAHGRLRETARRHSSVTTDARDLLICSYQWRRAGSRGVGRWAASARGIFICCTWPRMYER